MRLNALGEGAVTLDVDFPNVFERLQLFLVSTWATYCALQTGCDVRRLLSRLAANEDIDVGRIKVVSASDNVRHAGRGGCRYMFTTMMVHVRDSRSTSAQGTESCHSLRRRGFGEWPGVVTREGWLWSLNESHKDRKSNIIALSSHVEDGS